ncbi:MAG: efflux RND transporter periplasmic adaptor subunit [Pseudomonadota bacterium]|nr:efflux RND transporter periplasmic adaptor subunit [Pseudomonadota bacterium]
MISHARKQGKKRLATSSFLQVCIVLLGISGAVLPPFTQALAGTVAETDPFPAGKMLLVDSLTVQVLDRYEVMESYAGRVLSRRSSSLGFERSGQLESIRVDEGDRVAKGDVLAQLNTRRLEAKIAELKAELKRSQAQRQETEVRLQLARKTAERNRKMAANKQVSTQVYDESVFEAKALSAQLAAADARVEHVEATIKVLEVDLDRSTLSAPFAGSIMSRWADEGTIMGVGERVLRLIEDQKLEVHVGVPSHATAGMEEGQSYEIEIGGETHDAKLRTLLSEIDSSTRTVKAIFELGSEPRTARVGQLARLKMIWWTEAAGFWLPISALAEGRRGLWSAYALEPTGPDPTMREVSLRELQLLHSEEDRAFVRGTLRDGDVVVANGLHRLVPGQRVRIVDSGKNESVPDTSSNPTR